MGPGAPSRTQPSSGAFVLAVCTASRNEQVSIVVPNSSAVVVTSIVEAEALAARTPSDTMVATIPWHATPLRIRPG